MSPNLRCAVAQVKSRNLQGWRSIGSRRNFGSSTEYMGSEGGRGFALITGYLFGLAVLDRPNKAVAEAAKRMEEDMNKMKTREELLAEERDYKRRRMSYRGKKVKRTPRQV
ncbi:unnamed protein product [Thlaspi arvense]|uniref:Uncharacterized protein n=1 Tax=Thlaspi arvense TaxID=13288 RepID=A0AAU9S4Q7_THLAR|nr:unnamed protein product [Thlaspi arvense]